MDIKCRRKSFRIKKILIIYMKTRKHKLYHNITKKKHNKVSRKKKIYKNKTKRGGNPIIIGASAAVGSLAAGAGWWFINRKKRGEREGERERIDNIYEKDDSDDGVIASAMPGHIKVTGRLKFPCKMDLVGQEIERITRPYFTSPDFTEVLQRIKKIYSDMDKNPKVGDMISIHSDFYKDEMFQKQNKAYELFITDLDTRVSRKVPIQYRPSMEIIYKDDNNYYCIYNGGIINYDSIFKMDMSRSSKIVTRGGANLGAILEERDVVDSLDPGLEGREREEAEKRQEKRQEKRKLDRKFDDIIIQNLGGVEERKRLSMEEKKLRYKFFVSLNNLFFESQDIREFYDVNITSLDTKDYDIIKGFIFGETEEYKHYISVYGTNAMKKIKLLNLISSNTICKFLMDYIEQELSLSDGITKGTQIYDLISESIRINWRINNIYDEDEKFILYGRETKQLPGEDKYELFNEPTRQLLDGTRQLRMNEQQYIGGSGRTIPPETELQKRRRERKEKINNSRLKLQGIHYDVEHTSDWTYFLSIIQDKLYFLNSQKQIPYEVLLILLGFILSTRGDSTMMDNKLVLVAINIVYNEIIKYSTQVLYELFDGSKLIKKKHRAQPGAWNRIIYSIPITTINEKVKARETLVKPGGDIMKQLTKLSKDLVETIPGFKEIITKYVSVLTDCKPSISKSKIKEFEKKILYSAYYFMLENLDDKWNKETIKQYKTNLDLLCDVPFDSLVENFGNYSFINTFNEIGLFDDEGFGRGLVSKFLWLRSWQHITGPTI